MKFHTTAQSIAKTNSMASYVTLAQFSELLGRQTQNARFNPSQSSAYSKDKFYIELSQYHFYSKERCDVQRWRTEDQQWNAVNLTTCGPYSRDDQIKPICIDPQIGSTKEVIDRLARKNPNAAVMRGGDLLSADGLYFTVEHSHAEICCTSLNPYNAYLNLIARLQENKIFDCKLAEGIFKTSEKSQIPDGVFVVLLRITDEEPAADQYEWVSSDAMDKWEFPRVIQEMLRCESKEEVVKKHGTVFQVSMKAEEVEIAKHGFYKTLKMRYSVKDCS